MTTLPPAVKTLKKNKVVCYNGDGLFSLNDIAYFPYTQILSFFYNISFCHFAHFADFVELMSFYFIQDQKI